MLRESHFLPLAAFTVVALLLVMPVIGPLYLSNLRDPLLGSHDSSTFSLDLLALIIPGGHWMFNQWTRFYWSQLPGNINESSVYLGLSVFFLIGYVWVKRKTLDLFTRRQITCWSIILGFFFLLALGPALHIAGKIIWDKIMPYTLLVDIFPPSRSPAHRSG